MNVLFVGEDIRRSKSGVVTVMNQILTDINLKGKVNFKTIFTTGDEYSTAKKLFFWSLAYLKFLCSLPFCDITHIHYASNLNFWLSGILARTAKSFNKRVILHNHGADFKEFYNKSSNRSKKSICKVFKLAEANIVLSEDWLNWYRCIAPDANWFMLHNAIEIPENIYPKSLTLGSVNLIYLGRIEKRKGFFDLMEIIPDIIKEIPHAKLYIAGQGDLKKVRFMISQMKLEKSIIILGHVDSTQRDNILRLGHILIFPSYNEGLPMSLLEAMSYGVVPITTEVGGIPDVVSNNQNGLLIKPGDKKALFTAIITLINEPDKFAEMSKAAIDRIIKKFNFINYGNNLIDIYTFASKKNK